MHQLALLLAMSATTGVSGCPNGSCAAGSYSGYAYNYSSYYTYPAQPAYAPQVAAQPTYAPVAAQPVYSPQPAQPVAAPQPVYAPVAAQPVYAPQPAAPQLMVTQSPAYTYGAAAGYGYGGCANGTCYRR